MNWLCSKWWKWLCVVLLLYVVAGSFFVPLGPGVTQVTPSVFRPDSVYTFHVNCYHSHFVSPDAGKVQLWFKNQSHYYAPVTFKITGNAQAEAQFSVASFQQDSIKPSEFDVVLNDDLDGTFALRDAITFVPSGVDSSSPTSLRVQTLDSSMFPPTSAKITEPEVKNNRHRLFCFPYREILYETIRNTFFHVPMWFVMTILAFTSCIGSILYLTKGATKWDMLAEQSVIVALLFGTCGYLTGLVWAKYTWYIGVSWGDVIRKLLLEDIKMAAALIAMFFYIAYLVLRGSLTDKIKQAKVSAIYNVFAFVVFILCVFVLPRLTDSMHPGNGGNPAFSKYDLDSTLRMFFYPAVIGWILLGFWILSILMRIQFIKQKQES